MPEMNEGYMPPVVPSGPSVGLLIAVWTSIAVLFLPRLATGLNYVLIKYVDYPTLQFLHLTVIGLCDVMLIASLAWFIKLKKSDLGIERITIGDILLAVSLGVLWSALGVWYVDKTGLDPTDETVYRNVLKPPAGLQGGLIVAISCLATAAGEELFFRAFLIPQLRKIIGFWLPAVILSSLLFAMAHLYQGQTAVAFHFACAMGVGCFYLLCPRVLPFIVGHALCNGLLDYDVYPH